MRVARQRLQSLIGERGANCEVIEALQFLVFDAEHIMHRVVEVTPDPGAAHPSRFGFEVEHLTQNAGFPKQVAVKPRCLRQAGFIFGQHAEAEGAVGGDVLATG